MRTYDNKQPLSVSFEQYWLNRHVIVMQKARFGVTVFYNLAKNSFIKTVSGYEPLPGTDVGNFRDRYDKEACLGCKGLITNMGEVLAPQKYGQFFPFQDSKEIFKFRSGQMSGLFHRTKGSLVIYELPYDASFQLEPIGTSHALQYIQVRHRNKPILGEKIQVIGLLDQDYKSLVPIRRYDSFHYDPALQRIQYQSGYYYRGLLYPDGTPFLDSVDQVKAIPVGEKIYYAAHKIGTFGSRNLTLFSPEGRPLSKQRYSEIVYDDYFEGFLLSSSPTNWEVLDTAGNTILTSNSCELTKRISKDVFVLQDYARKGLGHRQLGVIHEPTYSSIEATTLDTIFVAEELCNYTTNCKYLLTISGKVLGDQGFTHISRFQPNGNFIVTRKHDEQTSASLLSPSGDLIGNYHAIHPCDDNLLHLVERYQDFYLPNISYGLIDQSGLEIIPPVLIELKVSGNRYRAKVIGGDRYLFDQNGRVLKGDASHLSELIKSYYDR